MTDNDYLKKYKKFLRRGETEKANEMYAKHRGDNGADYDVENDYSEEEKNIDLTSVVDGTISDVKEFVEHNPGFEDELLELEMEGKDRATLKSFLEDKTE